MRSIHSFLALSSAALCCLAPDTGVTAGGSAKAVSASYRRKSDGVIVQASQATSADIATVPGVNLPPAIQGEPTPTPYVVTKTGAQETVYANDFVVTENDGEHYYTYPADKFEAEYEALPATPPAGTGVTPNATDTVVDTSVIANNAAPASTTTNPDGTVTTAGTAANPGTHTPSSPDAPTADEAAAAVSTILEHLPKLAGSLVEGAKIAAGATHFTEAQRTALLAAAGVVDKRFKML